MSTRISRVDRMNKQMMRDISEIIRTVMNLPETFKFLSVTSVKIAKDQSSAKVFISHFNETESEHIINALNNAAWDIRQELKTRVKWKRIPNLHFTEDDSIKRGMNIITKINKAEKGSEGLSDE